MLLNNRLNQITAQIESYQAQISELQHLVSELQAHAQGVQSAEAAAESALSQIRTAIDMLAVICPEEINVFKASVDALFAPEPLRLAAYEETDMTAEVDPVEPTPPTDDEVVDVASATVVEDKPEVNGNGHNGNGKVIDLTSIKNGNGHHPKLLTVDDLKKEDRHVLVKLANQKKIDGYKSKTRDQLAQLLDSLVSEAELVTARNGKGRK